jgi:Flp pilus assembly pilin Flp
MGQRINSLWQRSDGATAIEYAFIASLIALAIAASVGAIAAPLNGIFTSVSAGF